MSPALSTFKDAAPVTEAVIVPAAKSPDASRITAVEITLVELNVTFPSFQILFPNIVRASGPLTLISSAPLPSVACPPVDMNAD